jgi:hypothetical protein
MNYSLKQLGFLTLLTIVVASLLAISFALWAGNIPLLGFSMLLCWKSGSAMCGSCSLQSTSAYR